MQIVRSSEELARHASRARRQAGAGSDNGRASRRPYGIDCRGQAPRGQRRGDDLRQSDAIRGERGLRPVPAPRSRGCQDARGGRLRPPLVARRRGYLSRGIFNEDPRFGRVGAVGGRSSTGSFRRSGDCRRQAVAVGSAGRCPVRREGFPAARGDPADGRRTSIFAVEILGVPTMRE